MRALLQASGKMVLLDKLLPKLQAQGHKVLLFSQVGAAGGCEADGAHAGHHPGLPRHEELQLRAHRRRREDRRPAGGDRPLLGAGLRPLHLPDLHAGGRLRHQPDGGRHGDHLRQRLEPAERHPGAGAVPPHRAGQGGERVPADHEPHVRDGDVSAREPQAGAGQGGAEPAEAEREGGWVERPERRRGEARQGSA